MNAIFLKRVPAHQSSSVYDSVAVQTFHFLFVSKQVDVRVWCAVVFAQLPAASQTQIFNCCKFTSPGAVANM